MNDHRGVEETDRHHQNPQNLQNLPQLRDLRSPLIKLLIVPLSYITQFLQHKNRSLIMITIFLKVNIQYLLHFQIYFVIIVTQKPKVPIGRSVRQRAAVNVINGA